MPKILIKRGTFRQLEDALTVGALAAGELYLVDGKMLAVGVGPADYIELIDTKGNQSLYSKTIYDAVLRTRVTFYEERALGNIGGTRTINFATFQKARGILNANANLSFSFPGVSNYQLILQQDSAGGRAVTINGVSYWVGATSQPAINTAPNGRTIVSLYYDGAALTCGVVKLNAV